VKETRYCLGHNRHVPSLATFIQVLSNSGALQRVVVSLKDVHIIPNPLLDEGRKECGRKTENEGHEPKHVHANIGCGWIESRESGWRSQRDGELWG